MVERVYSQILFARGVYCDQYFQIFFAHLKLLFVCCPFHVSPPCGRLRGRDLKQIAKPIFRSRRLRTCLRFTYELEQVCVHHVRIEVKRRRRGQKVARGKREARSPWIAK